ncbi:MAG: hypothetical protein ACRCTJ_06655 [Brevinema sp.]
MHQKKIRKKDKLVELTMPSSGHPMTYIKNSLVFLLFVMDFNKINQVIEAEGQKMHIHESLESLMVGSVDTGIAAATATPAEALGFGTVMIGAIRRSPAEIIKLFNLPKYTFPILGLCIGYASTDVSPDINPRLPMKTLVHKNTYDLLKFDQILKEYNQLTELHYLAKGMKNLSYAKLVSNYYSKSVSTESTSVYKAQGFKLD